MTCMFSCTLWTPPVNILRGICSSEEGRRWCQTTSTLLATLEGEREESTRQASQRSDPEREVLALLRRPAGEPLTIEDIRRELLLFFTELEIQSALIALLRKELIVYNNATGFSPSLELNANRLTPNLEPKRER